MTLLGHGELETAAEMGAALRAGSVSSADLVERAIRRAEAWQPAINAFSALWPEEAMADAAGVRSGDGRPLAGVPVAVKDLFDVAGHETTGCCAAYHGKVVDRDAPTIERVRAAGLVMIGKTNQHELAAGGTNLISACGPTRNPWDPERITGGSSGGSAAAVAAGVVPWSLGSDTGGSIRIPASLCGTFGLKPTTGRLPTEGMLPLAPSLDCPGPLAATVEDLGLLLGILRGPGAEHTPTPTRIPVAVGVPGGYFRDFVQDEVLACVEATSEVLRDTGVRVDHLEGGGIDDARQVWIRTCYSEFARAHPALRGLEHLVAPSVRSWMEEGARMSEAELDEARRRREEIGRWFRERLHEYDALLVPTTPYPAYRAGDLEVDLGPAGRVRVDRIGPGRLTSPVNLAGLPAVSFPAGTSQDGMPIGVSLIGRDDGEGDLLATVVRWEEAAGHRPLRRYPQLPDPTVAHWPGAPRSIG